MSPKSVFIMSFIVILATYCTITLWLLKESSLWDIDRHILKYGASKDSSINKNLSATLEVVNPFTNVSLSATPSWTSILQMFTESPYVAVEKALEWLNATASEEILRSGIGLQTYVTETNETIWVENGVQYRPFPYLEQANSSYYDSDFEAYIPFNKTQFFEGDPKKIGQEIKEKKIILWWLHKGQKLPYPGLNPLRGCPDFPCFITTDRLHTENSSAVIVNAQYVNNEEPPSRRPDQIFVHYQIEPPMYYWIYGNLFKKYKMWNEVFNWTMSYRRDSDITVYYGLVRRRPVVIERDYRKVLALKAGAVAWMVSSCNATSNRTAYVKELQKYVQVDIYGGCGTKQCPRASDRTCFEDINRKYKFYLGFENNLCKDYITEKLYRYMHADLVLIARGHNSYSRILPSEIFLNAADFASPKALGERIQFLNQNDEEYMKILKEKDKYFTLYEDYPLGKIKTTYLEYRYEAVPTCTLCQRLWNIEKYAKTYSDMEAWFLNSTYQCDKLL